MAVQAILNAFCSINATDISSDAKAVTLSIDVAELDTTTMGSTYQGVIGGVKSGSLSIEVVDDVAAAAIDSVLFPLIGTVVAFVVRMDSAAVGDSNPEYTGSVLVQSYSVGGSHGELAMKSLTFPTSGTISRAVA